MIKISVLGSHYFEQHLQEIQSEGHFPHIQLSFIFDYFSWSEAERYDKVMEQI